LKATAELETVTDSIKQKDLFTVSVLNENVMTRPSGNIIDKETL